MSTPLADGSSDPAGVKANSRARSRDRIVDAIAEAAGDLAPNKDDSLPAAATSEELMSSTSSRTLETCANFSPSQRASNRFRSNVEIVEKPRQMVVLLITVAGASCLGFTQNDGDPDHQTKAAALGVSLVFVTHCFLQCRDSLFVRPHPGIWRIVHALGMLYLLGVAVLFIHSRDEARRLLAIFIPDVRGHKQSNFDAGPLECELTFGAVLSQLREVWFLAHLVGWWCKMCLFRDWGVCWILSVGFELLELSMGWLVPQFHECWWDSLIIDLLGANVIGMLLGHLTLRFLETRTYDWNRRDSSTKLARSLRVLSSFSPFRWSKWRWQAFSSFKRTAQVFAMISVTMLLELNAFMVMNALEIPKNSNFNVIRIMVLFFVALLACSEFYEYCSNPSCDRLGQNAWLILAIMQVEILLWIKFFPQPLLSASSPPEVKLPWLATLSLFSLWGLLFFAVSEEPGVAGGSATSASGSFNSVGSLLDNGRGGDGSGSDVHDKDGYANGRDRTAGEASPADNRRALLRRDSSMTRRTKRQTAMLVVKWGLVDAGFVLSFLPLLYLVKQWSY